MKTLEYQQRAIAELSMKTIGLLKAQGERHKLIFEAPTGAGKTYMACQALASIVDELKERGDCPCQEVAFIWFAPHKLHIQSYERLKSAFAETRKLAPQTYDELNRNEGIKAGEILFVNWESVNKEGNRMVRETENSDSLYEITRRTKEELQLPIVAIIDEEHMFWSKTADRSAAVLDKINPKVEIRISATPKTKFPDELVRVQRQDVIEAEMIKKEIILNPEIELNFSNELVLNENLIKEALKKRNEIEEAHKELNTGINPLLLIQLPNDTSANMTDEDTAVAEQVKTYLNMACGITEENGLLAVWLANTKSNLPNLEKNDNMAKVLLFKEAIALGWDCPRAAVLLIFRKLQSTQFTTQTVGRIMRMPEQKHYPKEILNLGYVYTDIAREQIEIVAEDAKYILKDALTAKRKNDLENVTLPSFYSERPNVERNYLGPSFRMTLYETAQEFWNLPQESGLFAVEEMLAMMSTEEDEFKLPEADDEVINMNRRTVERCQHPIRLNVKNINVEIPTNVHFQDEEQVLHVDQARFARKESEITKVFMDYIAGKGGQFESKGRTDKISCYLLEMLEDYFGLIRLDAMKVVLFHENKPKFNILLDRALQRYAEKRAIAKRRSSQIRKLKTYTWEVPEERTYDVDTNHIEDVDRHALEPFVQLNTASNPEKKFVAFLESHKQWIDWWYKNGDKGKQHYAIPYGEESNRSLFYVDFVVRMKNGHVYLFDTKTVGSDMMAPEKHNALLQYMRKNTTDEMPLFGGILIEKDENWLYSKLPIANTTDTTNWDSFYPQNA